MMYLEDIEADLARRDMRGVEDAFRALIGFPKEDTIQGASDPQQLTAALSRACRVLARDRSIVPSGTIDIINDVLGNASLGHGASYATAAKHVGPALDRWQARHVALFSG
jgi:hypothetical protein